MKQKIVFALIMGILTTGIISFTLITVNLGWAHLHASVWLRSWAIAYLIVVPAILAISPWVEKLVLLLIPKNKKMQPLEIMKGFIGKTFSASPSPFMRWLNPVVKKVESGALVFEYQVREEWLNPVGNLHGGVTAAIIDDVLGATMFSLNEEFFYTTINNVIDYFSVAKAGETIVAKTRIIKKGKQFINAECEIWNADETRLIAKGYSNLFKTDFKKN